MDSAKVTHQPTSQTWRVAPGSLRGTIFYWEVNRGRILKINPGASSAVPAFEPGPPDQIGTPAPTRPPRTSTRRFLRTAPISSTTPSG